MTIGPEWRTARMRDLARLHPDQPAPLTAGQALALLEDFAIADVAIREALHVLCVDEDRHGAVELLAEAIDVCTSCGGTGIASVRRQWDDAPLICCGGPR